MEISRRRILVLTSLMIAISALVLYGTVDKGTAEKLAEFYPAVLPAVMAVIAGGMYFDARRLIRRREVDTAHGTPTHPLTRSRRLATLRASRPGRRA